MKKTGFTLIEVMAVLAILAIASIVIVNSLTTSMEKNKENNFNTFVEKITTAACSFIELSPTTRAAAPANTISKDDCRLTGCTITIEDLINTGLIDKDLANPLHKDNKLKTNYSTVQINIEWDSEVKICSLDETVFE